MKFKNLFLISLIAVTIAAATGFSAPPAPAGQGPLETLKIDDFSGIMTITTPDMKVINVTRQSEIPPRITMGSKIEVISGRATVTAGSMTLYMRRGNKVRITLDPLTNTYEFVVPDKNKGSIKLAIGPNIVTLTRGNIVSVIMDEKNHKAEVLSVIGDVKVITAQGIFTVTEGKSVETIVPDTLEIAREQGIIPEPKGEILEEASPSVPQ